MTRSFAHRVFKESRHVVCDGENDDNADLNFRRPEVRCSELLNRPTDGVVSVDRHQDGQPDGGRMQHHADRPDVVDLDRVERVVEDAQLARVGKHGREGVDEQREDE